MSAASFPSGFGRSHQTVRGTVELNEKSSSVHMRNRVYIGLLWHEQLEIARPTMTSLGYNH